MKMNAVTGIQETFKQMRERSVKCALWFKKIGIQRNDIETIYTSYFDTYVSYLATLYIGAILFPWQDEPIHECELTLV